LAAGPAWAWTASTPTASIAASTPMPPVSRLIVAAGSSLPKSTVSAPCARAIASRSACSSTAKMRPACISFAEAIANCPTGPQPNTATVWPGLMPARSAPK
jgi:hypothetical protein